MQVKITIGRYDHYLAELSGSELEVFARIAGKMIHVDATTLSGKEAFVKHPDTGFNFNATVLAGNVPLMTKDEADALHKVEQAMNRKRIVDTIVAADEDRQADIAKDLLKQLWYDDTLTKTAHEQAVFKRASASVGVTFTLEDGSPLTVQRDGSILFA
jgi:hypothetical protein